MNKSYILGVVVGDSLTTHHPVHSIVQDMYSEYNLLLNLSLNCKDELDCMHAHVPIFYNLVFF